MKSQLLNNIASHNGVRTADIILSVICIFLCLPMLAASFFLSVFKWLPFTTAYIAKDCLGRRLTLTRLTSFPNSSLALLFDVLRGEISFCGLEIIHEGDNCEVTLPITMSRIKAGIFSLTALHEKSGLAVYERKQLVVEQIEHFSMAQYFSVFVKSLLVTVLYTNKNLDKPSSFHLFGLRIDNTSMSEAVEWIVTKKQSGGAKLGFFVNVNSVNLSNKNLELRNAINSADRVFADGSGVRIGAKHKGIALRDNVNGTDLLPPLCSAAEQASLSIYFLGSAPGVAEATAKKLREQYPLLKIAGVGHGFFPKNGSENSAVINRINQSKADILLVGFGSPIQETWLQQHSSYLSVDTALAVGGLFDFYSDSIARSPQWLRELGLEWVWRLVQDPATKWQRYLLGNPLFLYRLWFSYED